MEAVEDRKFSAASRRATEIVMVMNSQPTLHDRKSMLYWGTLLRPIMENIRRAMAFDVLVLVVAMQRMFTFVHIGIGKP
ncbi:MAG TPA: hypothetical protein VFI51_13915 [Bradyrhizobium sp.]|nr:hypothetical protein [Bradyrhizobium sp.]